MTSSEHVSPSHWAPLIAAAVCTALLVTVLALVVTRHGTPPALDSAGHHWFLTHREHLLTNAAILVTTTGTGAPAYALALLAGTLNSRRQHRVRGAVVAVVALAVGQALRLILATSISRTRPPVADWAWHASGPALPSGHTTTSALVAALLCHALSHADRSTRVRVTGCALALLWTTAVGVSRVYLGVHWPSDVAAGWLFAATLALLALPLTRRLRDLKSRLPF